MSSPPRDREDACPGVLSPSDAADGSLARVRLPGGVAGSAALLGLAACATDLGDGRVHLTSRGNVQLRGLRPGDPAVVRRISAAGLLPSPAHERVRNIIASPLSGIRGGHADVRGLATVLDRILCARSLFTRLPGRFLFALDDGRGDVAGERPDVCWQATSDDHGRLVVAGSDTGLGSARAAAPALLAAAAAAFLRIRESDGSGSWRAVELPDAAARIGAELGETGRIRAGGDDRAEPDHRSAPEPRAALRTGSSDRHEPGPLPLARRTTAGGVVAGLVGLITRDAGGHALGAAPPLGELDAAQLRTLAGVAPVVLVTPWRTVLVPEPGPGAAAALAAAGLVVDPTDPAVTVSACAGRPGCAKALADVRADLRAALAAGAVPRDVRTHVVGCGRGCGAPSGPHLRPVADGRGYTVAGVHEPDLVSALARQPSGSGPPH